MGKRKEDEGDCSSVCAQHACNWINVSRLFHDVTHKLISFFRLHSHSPPFSLPPFALASPIAAMCAASRILIRMLRGVKHGFLFSHTQRVLLPSSLISVFPGSGTRINIKNKERHNCRPYTPCFCSFFSLLAILCACECVGNRFVPLHPRTPSPSPAQAPKEAVGRERDEKRSQPVRAFPTDQKKGYSRPRIRVINESKNAVRQRVCRKVQIHLSVCCPPESRTTGHGNASLTPHRAEHQVHHLLSVVGE